MGSRAETWALKHSSRVSGAAENKGHRGWCAEHTACMLTCSLTLICIKLSTKRVLDQCAKMGGKVMRQDSCGELTMCVDCDVAVSSSVL